MKRFFHSIYGLALIGWIFSPLIVHAQPVTAKTDLGSFQNIGEFLAGFFVWAIPITGSLSVLMLIYAGYLYMTSQGNQEGISTAKEIITGVVVGLLVLFTAEILLSRVIGTLH